MSLFLEDIKQAKKAGRIMATLDHAARIKALQAMREALATHKAEILAANAEDLTLAEQEGGAKPLLARLKFDEHKLTDVAAGISSLEALADPLGQLQLQTELADGLLLKRVSVPLGLIAIVFEARPDALVQIASLCVKSGNALVLKGGSEAANSNRVLAELLYKAACAAGLPEGWLVLLEAREDVKALLALDEYVDLLIPRGSNDFVRYIMSNTKIPVLGHADGVCHSYVSGECDRDMAVKLLVDAKTQYVSVCNATECILLDRKLMDGDFPEKLAAALTSAACKMYGDEELSRRLGLEQVKEWHYEYLDWAVSLKVVDGVEAAVEHINTYGSGHTDAIITTNEAEAERFMSSVDTANAFWNCSTRFSDGFRYGFGAEVGVSTSKIHARGPVGLAGLTTYKYKLYGHGDIVGDFAGGSRSFTHKTIS